MSFADRERQRSVADNLDAITSKMVSAALQADVGGGQKAIIYASYDPNIVRKARMTLSSRQLKQIPQDCRDDLQAAADGRIYSGMGGAASRFQSELEKLALILYIQAKNPEADIDRALRMQQDSLRSAVETWNHYANLDAVFPNNRDYIGSPQRIPNMLSAVETAMRKSLKDQGVAASTDLTPY